MDFLPSPYCLFSLSFLDLDGSSKTIEIINELLDRMRHSDQTRPTTRYMPLIPQDNIRRSIKWLSLHDNSDSAYVNMKAVA